MPRWILNEPEEHCHPAEIATARLFLRLPDDWIIRWGYFYEDEEEVRREGDFLILIPSLGVIVLEVKSGRPRHFTPSGDWAGPDGGNPLRQLDHQWGAIVREAKQSPLGRVFIAKALCYPELTKEQISPESSDTCYGLPWSAVITGGDFASREGFTSALKRIFAPAIKAEKLNPVDSAVRDAFLNSFGEGSRAREISEFLDHNEARVRQQITAEYRLIELLSDNQQLMVKGGPGSGKSWYALEQARQYAHRGYKVLFVVYNRALTEVMQHDIKHSLPADSPGSVELINFEQLAAKLLGTSLEELTQNIGDDAQNYWEETLPSQLLEKLRGANPELLPQYDALVVDEGQDHDTELLPSVAARYPEAACGWWSIYWRLLREDTSSPMAIFYDQAQRPSFRDPTRFQPERLRTFLSQPALVSLDRSLRYSRPVFEFLQSLEGPGIEPLVAGLGVGQNLSAGPSVVVKAAKNQTNELLEQVTTLVDSWDEQGLSCPEDILILHLRSDIDTSVLGQIAPVDDGGTRWLGPYRLHAEGTPGPGLRHCSIHKAKGLDARAVILLGVNDPSSSDLEPSDRFTLFMGASRARQLLAIIHQT